LGSFKVKALQDEEPARLNARRSLVADRHIRKGVKIKAEDLTYKRPAHGISPKFIDDVIGKLATIDINEDEVIQWDMLTR
jgi:N-acetylneuraminate synthase